MQDTSKKQLIDDPDFAKVWVIRAILLKGKKHFLRDKDFSDDDLALYLGLDKYLTRKNYNKEKVIASLKKMLGQLECSRAQIPDAFSSNLDTLSKALGLSKSEKSILSFLITLRNEPMLSDGVDTLGDFSPLKTPYYLSFLLDLKESDVREALNSNGLLFKTGIVEKKDPKYRDFSERLIIPSELFAERMYTSVLTDEDLYQIAVKQVKGAQLNIEDYSFLGDRLTLVKHFLRSIRDSNKVGSNILLYGPPGTGKTELAKSLAEDSEYELYEVSSVGEDLSPLNGEERLNAYCLAQHLLQGRNGLIVFDETEDIFSSHQFFGSKNNALKSKAWFNCIFRPDLNSDSGNT